MNWSEMHRMESGASYEAARAHARLKKRRKRRTKTVCVVALLAIACQFLITVAVRRSAKAATLAGEECYPLAGRFISAVVVVRQKAQPQLLWWPTYVRDESPGDVIRAHERSVLCPGLKTRIRPKRVNVSHFPWQTTSFSDKYAVCVTHYSDVFLTGVC
jgi:hypothetical protein